MLNFERFYDRNLGFNQHESRQDFGQWVVPVVYGLMAHEKCKQRFAQYSF
jgi:hypothetical protein